MPQVGWPVRYSQQHEDFMLTKQRGMPAPFDNSSMRAAWLSVLLTNWMGDGGFLRRLKVSTVRPVIYGDANWYTGKVLRLVQADQEIYLTIRLSGTNQLGEITTTGEAEIVLPRQLSRLTQKTDHSIDTSRIEWGRRALHSEPVTVCDLFAKQVQFQPDAIAIVCDEQTLTYKALDTRAESVARELQAKGLQAGNSLGLYLDRRPDTVVAILACCKAGIAYVPLDPAYPSAKLGQMIEGSELNFVLTNGAQFDVESERSIVQLQLESFRVEESVEAGAGIRNTPTVDSPAYVLFTSGTTGRSKVVTVDHGSLGVYHSSLMESLDVTKSDVYLNTASFSFSASIRQFWLPLCAGAKMVLVDEETRLNPLSLFEMIQRTGATVWDTVPSILAYTVASLQELDEERRSLLIDHPLRRIFTTGEPLVWDTVRAWNQLPGIRGSITNLYSQTETVGTVTVFPVTDTDRESKGYVPLGRPIPDTGICLLDDQLQSVDIGKVGEICVAGERLKWYDSNPVEEHSERFVRVGLSDGTEELVFRTGDLGRRSSDGDLEFVGRTDDQIKIRGLRVNLKEIEVALGRNYEVAQCAVIAVAESEESVDASLIAYVVPRDGIQLDLDDLKAKIARWLPDFMLPYAIIKVDSLPLTPNGKLDRLALPLPGPDVKGERSTEGCSTQYQ